MSFLQQYNDSATRDVFATPTTTEDLLKLEHGWKEVASGLGRMLFGYFLIFGVVFLGLTMVLYVMLEGRTLDNAGPIMGQELDLEFTWIVAAGGGIMGLMMLASYYFLLTGQWKCAIYAPDRCGAKWLIFICMICLLFGPIAGFALNTTRAQEAVGSPNAYLQKVASGQAEQQIGIAELIGPTISLATTIMFVLFLRALGICFEHNRLVQFVDMYLTFTALIVGISIFLLFSPQLLQDVPILALAVTFGWLGSVCSYVFLVLYARLVIHRGMGNLRSPLETT